MKDYAKPKAKYLWDKYVGRVAKRNRTKNYSQSYKTFLHKESERDLGEFAMKHDSPDKFFGKVQSSKGRVGHFTHLRFDAITSNWVWENKKTETLSKKDEEAYINLLEKAMGLEKFPIMRLDIQAPIRDNICGLERIPQMMVIPEEVFGIMLELINACSCE